MLYVLSFKQIIRENANYSLTVPRYQRINIKKILLDFRINNIKELLIIVAY